MALHTPGRVSRRLFLGGAAGTALTAILAACGGSTATVTPAPVATATKAASTTAPAAATTAPTTAAAVATTAPTTVVTTAPVAATTAPTVAATTAPTAAATQAIVAPTTAAASSAASTTGAGSSVASAGGTATVKPVATGESGLAEATAVPAMTTGAVPNLTGKLSIKKINIAFVPGDDPSTFFQKNNDLFAYMKQSLGVDIVGAVGANYTAVITAMQAKKIELASFGPFSYILAHENANAQCFLLGQTADGKLATYNSLIMAPADSPLQTLADIKGKNFSFVDPASTSGHLVPSYTLLQKANLKETDYKPIYAGSHPASFQAIANKKVDAGAVASDIFASGIADGTIDKTKVKVIDTSFDIPGSPIAVRGDISQADQDTLLQMFLALNDRPKDDKLYTSFILKGGFGVGTVKVYKGDDSVYNDLRKIPAAIGVDIKTLK